MIKLKFCLKCFKREKKPYQFAEGFVNSLFFSQVSIIKSNFFTKKKKNKKPKRIQSHFVKTQSLKISSIKHRNTTLSVTL